MNKKGFTLIELLAVIVILAIIALIATPAVLNIIEDSRKSAAEASARNIVNAAKTYYMSETMNGRTPGNIDLSTDTLKYDGDQASKGNITFSDGKPSGKMYVGGYCVEISLNGVVTSEKMNEEDCDVTVEITTPVTYTKYNNGDPLYFNPTDGVKCTDTEAVSTTGTKSGCMKFYAFLDSEESSTVKLILDHNTTSIVWCSDVKSVTEPDKSLNQIYIDTTGWKQIVDGEEQSVVARMISAEEIVEIVPLTPFSYEGTDDQGNGVTINVNAWNQSDKNTKYYLHTGTQTKYEGEIGTNQYAWLFNNLKNCTTYGCNIEDSAATGYWTSSYAYIAENGYVNAWIIKSDGQLTTYNANNGLINGVRPVIEVSKSVFE